MHNSTAYLHCTLAAAQCTVVGPVCLFVAGWVGVCVWVGYHVNSKLCASILTKLGLLVKVVSSDHLQLTKFWPSRAPGKEVCGVAKIFGSALLQPVRSVFVSLSAFFITTY